MTRENLSARWYQVLGPAQPQALLWAWGRVAGRLHGRNGPGVLVDGWLNRSQQCAQMAISIVACISSSAASRRWSSIPPYSALWGRTSVLCAGLGPYYNTGMEALECVHRRERSCEGSCSLHRPNHSMHGFAGLSTKNRPAWWLQHVFNLAQRLKRNPNEQKYPTELLRLPSLPESS